MFSGDSKKFSDRLHWLRNVSLRLSFPAFAALTGLPKGYLHELERGKKTNPSSDFLERISMKTGVSREWLENGEGEPFPGGKPALPRESLMRILSDKPMNFELALKALLAGADEKQLVALAKEHLSLEPPDIQHLDLVLCILEELRARIINKRAT